MSQQRLFSYETHDSDCFISGTPDKPDKPQLEYMNWKMLAGVALAKEFVVRATPEEGYEFRVIPLTI